MDTFYAAVLRRLELAIFQIIASSLLGIAVIFSIYWYSTRRHDYWKKRGVQHIKPLPFLGTLLTFLRKPLHEADLEVYEKNGRLYGLYEGNNPVLTVAEPDLIRDILVKDFQFFQNRRIFKTGDALFDNMLSILTGEDWKRVRTIISPTFTTGKIKRMLGIFKDSAQTLINNFRTFAEREEAVDSKRLYGAFTMDVIASTSFSTKIDSHNDPSNEFVSHAKNVFAGGNKFVFLIFFLFPSLFKHFKISIFPAKSMEFFRKVTLQIIEQRKKTGETRNDFLQLMMDTSKEFAAEGKLDVAENGNDDIVANYGKDESVQISKTPFSKKSLSHEEVVAQCVSFFVGGYETTASTLTFASYQLALNEDIQERLIKELDEALSETGGEWTYEAIQNMKYLDNVISETLRMYPPLVRIERTANIDYELKGTGITIPKGMIVQIPAFAMHRDPKNYSDPEKFDPDRFTAEERAKRHPYLYMPFGSGPRNCLAMRFALMEIKVCLAHVLKYFRIKRCPETKVPLEFHFGQGILQSKEVMLQLEIRKDKVPNL